MVALVTSIIGLGVGLAIVGRYMLRRPVGAPLTWGEAMVAATFVFFLMLLGYAIVPHQWIDYADKELQWRPDKVVMGPGNIIHNALPFTVTYEAVRDIVVVGIYGAMLTLQVAAWSVWQNRGRAKAPELPTSPYGRPLVKRT